VYRPLEDEHRDVRIVCIEPGEWQDELRCRIMHKQIKPSVSVYYEALSYAWEDPELTEVIDRGYAQGKLRTTKSCASAIRRLRYRDRERYLWIDALSINQHNVLERNSQVRMMGDIYERASRIVVYLGEDADNSLHAMRQIDTAIGIPAGISDQEAVLLLFKRPWFNRVWVIQEVVRAKSVSVVCGQISVPWKRFAIWQHYLSEGSLRKVDRHFQTPGVLLHGQGSTQGTGQLLQLLYNTRNCLSSDPRDKVIALFGLLSQPEQHQRRLTDYNMSVEELYSETAADVINETFTLELLCCVRRYTQPCNMPSWVPDWSISMFPSSIGMNGDRGVPFNAGGQPAFARILRQGPRNTPSALGVRGVRLSRIHQIAAVLPSPIVDYGAFSVVLRFWLSMVSDET